MSSDTFPEEDPLHLYRCAASYDWDGVVSYCEKAKKRVVDNIGLPGGERFASALHASLSAGDEWNNTAIHLCMFNAASLDVIEALLAVSNYARPPKAHRASLRSTRLDLTLLRTSDGSTPLLIACATGAHVDVLRLLIEKSSDPKALAEACDIQGRTPLLELCEWYNSKGRWKVKPVAPALDKIERHEELLSWMSLRFVWERVSVVLAAAAGTQSESILNKAAAASAAVPPILSNLVCRIRWHDVHQQESSKTLHNAIYHSPDAVTRWRKVMFFNNAYFVRQLLRSDPSTASLTFQAEVCGSCRWRNALCTAISSGLAWTASDEADSTTIPGVVQSIWEVTPDALVCRDEVTGLYPFMLAACSRPRDVSCWDLTTIETTYSLLRLSPELIQSIDK